MPLVYLLCHHQCHYIPKFKTATLGQNSSALPLVPPPRPFERFFHSFITDRLQGVGLPLAPEVDNGRRVLRGRVGHQEPRLPLRGPQALQRPTRTGLTE